MLSYKRYQKIVCNFSNRKEYNQTAFWYFPYNFSWHRFLKIRDLLLIISLVLYLLEITACRFLKHVGKYYLINIMEITAIKYISKNK